MKLQLYSKTTIGKWAAILTLAYIVLMLIKLFIRILPLPSPAIAVIGVAGAVTGVISFVKNKDRTVLTLVSIVLGLLILVWVALEFAFPH
ncbi:MAG: hypothetical protein PHZ09_10670 [Eubacteriales bacterium]|jgi:membrane associated rhomboid family serine protease|nr:hypothetical protein [Eubacteriales bacterium]